MWKKGGNILKKMNMKIFVLVFVTGFLLLLSFNSNDIANASTITLTDESLAPVERPVDAGLTPVDEDLTPLCLTCGGTITKDYKVTSSVREYGAWKDALRPIIYGGPSGGTKSYTESESYTSTISGSTGFDAGAIKSLVGYSSSYSKTFSETQSFNLKANTKYKLFKRPMYIKKTIRYSVYDMQNGGKQTFKEYRYVTAKKAEGIEINLQVVK